MTKEVSFMPADWERQAFRQELTEKITDGVFNNDYDGLTEAMAQTDLLTERDRQQLLQYWMAKEREQNPDAR
jgi:hypothetical protein